MGLRNAQARSRQLARQKAQQEQTDEDRFAFRRWKIRHDPGESGLYIPMLNGEGEYQIEEEIPAHKVGDSRRYVACTRELPDFNGECYYCDQRDKERQTKAKSVGVVKTSFSFLGVWDMNWWLMTMGQNNMALYEMWHGRHSGDTRPEEAVIGGPRFFRMGSNSQDSWNDFAESLEDVCECVAETGDPEVSTCYVVEVRCPECGCILKTDSELGRMGGPVKIRHQVLNQLQKCKPVKDGGCWTTEKEEDAFNNMFLPEAVYSCLNHEKNPKSCPEARPIDPFMKPMEVTRIGDKTATTYACEKPQGMSWAEYVNFEVPKEALEAFAEGMDFSKKLKVNKLNDQLKDMGLAPGGGSQQQRSRGYRRGNR